MVLKDLSPHTCYKVRVRSVVSTYKSTYSASIHVRTNATCDIVLAPNDGSIRGKKSTDNGYIATMACEEGFELLGDETYIVCDSKDVVGNQICSQERCRIPELFT
ncbi:hypothetical protein ACJMK2_018597 [Sinanodonta woodiana]|uniref:Fibronectin type-III domain-containing protein n=1 Tax=Sinanodonta woodiana TaxID=1069815 RepID=A0ABD3UE70_SINWO